MRFRLRSRRPTEADTTPGKPVNGFEILDKVVALPVSTWHYKSDPPGVYHLGPMAQDWKAAFGLGDTDKRIPVVDANGVAMVSIQALHHLITDLQNEVAELRTQVDKLS